MNVLHDILFMSIQEKLQSEVIASMKSGDTARRDALRMLLAAVKNEAINKGTLTEEGEIEVLSRESKRLKDARAEFETAGRTDLVEKSDFEIAIVMSFLPTQATDTEIEDAAKALGAMTGADVNKLMGPLMKQFKGKADGTRVREIVQKILAQ